MFDKLAKKYNVANPLQSSVQKFNKETSDSAMDTLTMSGRVESASNASPFSFGGIVTSTSENKLLNPSSLFDKNALKISNSPFSIATNSTPGFSSFGTVANSPFANTTTLGNNSPFGIAAPNPNTSSFGQPSPFSSAVSVSGTTHPIPTQSTSQSFVGKTPRDMLMAFYQQYNASKMSEVDRLLAKYHGNEEQMFRNLAKKYNLDPSVFGLSVVPASNINMTTPSTQSTGGFGQASVLGGGSPFSTQGTLGLGSPGNAFSQFGAATGFTSTSGGFGGASFGSLAHSSGPSSFAAPSPTPFGTTTPFGGPRR
jgi:hypothetical protein